jgi:septum formation protein
MPKLVLASTSKYRRMLLDRLGLSYSAHAPKVDEDAVPPGAAPDAVALQLAREKAESVAAAAPDAHIIGSDQLVDLDGERLGKPGSSEKAEAQLRRLAGREHRLVTAIALRHPDGRVETSLDTHVIRLRALTDAEVHRYVQRERPLDCAGSYKIESLGISLVESLAGEDFTAVIGLPLISLCKLLRAAGFEVP